MFSMPPAQPPAPRAPMTVLIADDSATQRALWIYSLGNAEAEVLTPEAAVSTPPSAKTRILLARSGEEAARLLEREPVALMVTDIDMPDVDGWSLIERARRARPALDVLVVSGKVKTGEQPPARLGDGRTMVIAKADRDLAVNYIRRVTSRAA